MATLGNNAISGKAKNRTPIQDFYTQTTVFITGGTGFLGIILIEKLLGSCPKLTKIYLLVREKKGKSIEERLKELFNDEVFKMLKSEQADFQTKVFGVIGDLAEINLGLSEKDRVALINEVNLVFHCAATVKVNELLKVATEINIRGTRDVFHLCRKMKNLKFVVHVSTAYTHGHHKPLKEKFYDMPYKPQMVIEMVENFSGIADEITNVVLNKFPNTYTFTKSIAEQIVQENRDLPVALIRPSIVVSTYKEPIAGWTNTYNGAQGIIVSAFMGLLRSIHCDGSLNSNVVPVDMVVSAMIAIPWENCKNKKKEVPIYNFESNTYCPISWTKFVHLNFIYGITHPPSNAVGYYFFHLSKSKFQNNLAKLFLHNIPGLLFDATSICLGKEPIIMKTYKKIHKYTDSISYFVTQKWTYESNNLQKLCDNLSDEDKNVFFCDLRRLDWDTYFKTYFSGCRLYLLKDCPDNLEFSKRRYNRLRIYSYAIVVMFVCLAFILTYNLLRLFG